MPSRYDLVVIGSGPAGEKGASRGAYFGKNIAVVERASCLGGASVNTGTIPSKTLRETALYFSGLRQRGLYGIDYSLREGVTIADFMYRERTVVEHEWELIRQNLARHRIDLYHGAASIASPHTVLVDQGGDSPLALETGAVLIATGSSPYHPPDVPFDDVLIYDSDSILRLKEIPRTLIVVGGGVIGCEYAALFAALGVEVTQITQSDALLPFVDREIAGRLHGYLERLGLRILFSDRVTSIVRRHGRVHLHLRSGQEISSDVALFAAGRTSNVEGLGLEALGMRLGERGLVLVDEHFQTSVPGIYAAGDVIGFPALASTSMEQGRAAVTHALTLPAKEYVAAHTPLAIYSIPEIAMVGLTEEKCIAEGIDYLVGKSDFNTLARGQIIGDDTGMVKLIFAPSDKRLLGAHLIGELASELVHIGAHVLMAGGTVETFIEMVYNFPTLSDAYKYAAYDGLGRHDRWLVEHGLAPSSQLPPPIPPLRP